MIARPHPAPLPSSPGRRGDIYRLDLNLLVAFEALRVEGSVSGAARRLGITQSGMSRALARLRAEFGDPLFVRGDMRMTLTPFAKGLAQPVARALEILATGLAAQVRFDPRSASRTFVIGTADYCEGVLFPPLLERLAREAPGLHIHSVPTLSSDPEALARGDLDMVIALRLDSRADLRTQKLMHEEFVTLVRVGHPAVKAGVLSLEDFLALEHVVVAPHGRPGSPIDAALEKKGLSRTTVVRLQSFMAAPALVEGTDRATTLPRLLAHRMASRYRLTLVPTPLDLAGFDLSLGWHERCQADSGHRWLRRVLAEIAVALQAREELV
jgi:DNA-binding transcriptional LysR family regulator